MRGCYLNFEFSLNYSSIKKLIHLESTISHNQFEFKQLNFYFEINWDEFFDNL